MNKLYKRIALHISIPYIYLLLHCSILFTAPIISLFFKPAPDSDYYLDKIKKPGRIAKYTLQGLTESDYISGIMCTYAGYVAISEKTGQLLFPRKTDIAQIKLAITPRITPIMRFEQTVDHWQFITDQPLEIFNYERKQEGKNNYYWSVTKSNTPANNIVDYNMIVIFAKPENIFIPLGNFATTESPHLLLPTIYVKKAINIVKYATYMLQMKHLFRQVDSKYKTEAKGYLQLIVD